MSLISTAGNNDMSSIGLNRADSPFDRHTGNFAGGLDGSLNPDDNHDLHNW